MRRIPTPSLFSGLYRLSVAVAILFGGAAEAQCVGDCDGGGRVEINELITGVNIATGTTPLADCSAFDANGSGSVTIGELIAGVGAALNGCTTTPTPGTDTPTPEASGTATGSATQTSTATPPSATPPATSTATATATATASNTPSAPLNSPVPSATFTPTPMPTMGSSAVCGNGFLEPGESCTSCPPDCVLGQCAATTTMMTLTVHFRGAPGTSPITATTLLGYRSDRVSIPGSGNGVSVRQRVTFPPPAPNVISINDLDYAIRVVVGRTAGLTDGRLYSITFDACQDVRAASAADFACTMEACAGAGGPIEDCTCMVTAP